MLGLESVWVVVAPVRSSDLWLGRRGLFHAARLFVVGSLIAWYAWTQRARPMIFHMPADRGGAPGRARMALLPLAYGAMLHLPVWLVLAEMVGRRRPIP